MLSADERTETGSGGSPQEYALARVLEVVGSAMQRERGRLNGLDSFGGPGTYGDRMGRGWTEAARAVRRAGIGDLGRDLALAGEALDTVAGGISGRLYRQGLLQAAAALPGRRTLRLSDLGTLLNGLLAGAQDRNAARPGQGTLLDVLGPAAGA